MILTNMCIFEIESNAGSILSLFRWKYDIFTDQLDFFTEMWKR